ncbi:MAG: hypothetical protein EOO99_06135 [Pedobacter sp.]|nr:MAG: hypothetical protein EOO99_06135 [Pedobacter sp.]
MKAFKTKISSIAILNILLVIAACGTVQSLMKSAFPYTASLIIPADAPVGTELTQISTAANIDQIFGNSTGTSYIKEIRVGSAKLEANNPSNQNLGVIKSVKLYIMNASGREVMVASRSELGENIGSNVVLDIDNSRFIDDYVKDNNLRIKMVYILRQKLNSDISVRASINLNSTPSTN